MKLTEEQDAIVQSDAELLKVNAFAGTGKTSTLVEYANARPKKRMLYLAFNKAIQVEAQGRFPSNVRSVTSHALAYRDHGSKYQNKLTPNLKANQIAQALDLVGKYEMQPHFALLAGQHINATLVRFFASKDACVTEAHVNMPPSMNANAHYDAALISALTQKLWEKMQSINDPEVGMLHDGYLKLYQLSNPKLNYDHILFDESQDANPCTLDFVSKQDSHKVFVGDAHQSIYLFRGAVNAMQEIESTQELALTGSFRFGKFIAETANTILYHMKGESRRIRGLGAQDELAPVQRTSPHAIICRSNATVFDEAVVSMSLGRKVAFVGGPGSYTFDKVGDAYKLSTGEVGSIRDPYIRSFGTMENLEAFAETTDDRELKSLSRVVKKYGREIPMLIKAIKNSCVEQDKANVTLTTAHKSKGLEWDQVRLTDDYVELLNKQGNIQASTEVRADELNILYVAATRAKLRLEVNGGLASFLLKATEEPYGRMNADMQAMLKKAAKAPQAITSSAAIKNLVKSKKEDIKLQIFGGRFNPKRDLGL